MRSTPEELQSRSFFTWHCMDCVIQEAYDCDDCNTIDDYCYENYFMTISTLILIVMKLKWLLDV